MINKHPLVFRPIYLLALFGLSTLIWASSATKAQFEGLLEPDHPVSNEDRTDTDEEIVDGPEKVTEKSTQKGSVQIKKILWTSLDAGPLFVLSPDETVETSKSGYIVGFKGSFTFVAKSLTFDLALGWASTSVTADSDPSQLIEEQRQKALTDSTFVGLEVGEITTDFGTVELGTRWRANKYFEIGPSIMIPFGVDTSFGPTISKSTLPNIFLGAAAYVNLVRPTYRNRLAVRLGIQGATDLTISERDVFWVAGVAQLGMLIGSKQKVLVRERVKVKYRTRYKTRIKKEIQTITKIKDHYLVDAGIINFATGSAKIAKNISSYLQELGFYLKTKVSKWSKIRIQSHTDHRGSAQLNHKLSSRRAEAIALIFRKTGIPQSRLDIYSNATANPVTSSQEAISLAKNRRVEILVMGGQETPQLKTKILQLQQKHRLPGTCQGGVCR